MKFEIAIPDKRLAVEINDADGERFFESFTTQLLRPAQKSIGIRKSVIRPATKPTDRPTIETEGNAYYLECASCGKRKSFRWDGFIRNYHCKACFAETVFDNNTLAKIDFACECGIQETYLTNITESAFKINCFVCHRDVEVAYDDDLERFGVVNNTDNESPLHTRNQDVNGGENSDY